MSDRLLKRSLIVGCLIGAALAFAVLGQVQLRDAVARLKAARIELFWLPLLLTFLAQPFRTWRWKLIFTGENRPGAWSCFSAISIGNLTNNVLPGRGGDLLRCVLIDRRPTLGGTTMTLATLGLEKVLDGLALLAVLLLSFLFLSPPAWMGRLAWLSALVLGGVLGMLLAAHFFPRRFHDVTVGVFRAVGLEALGRKAATLFYHFAAGLGVIRSLGQTAVLVLLTVGIWTIEAFAFWGMARAFHVEISIFASALSSAVIGLGMMIPAAPGYLGTYEFFSVAILKCFGVDPAAALALTLGMHAWVLMNTTFFGVVCLGASGMTFARVLGLGRMEAAADGHASKATDRITIQ